MPWTSSSDVAKLNPCYFHLLDMDELYFRKDMCWTKRLISVQKVPLTMITLDTFNAPAIQDLKGLCRDCGDQFSNVCSVA